MRQVWLGTVRRRIAIVLMVFGWGGLVVGKLCGVGLFELGKYIHWLEKLLDFDCGDLMHLLKFSDVSRNIRHVG